MIKHVTKENENIWAALCADLWPHYLAEEFIADRQTESILNEFLYYLGNKAVAFVSLSLRHDYIAGTSSSPVAFIEAIYVIPEYQDKGIGEELIEFAKDWARQNGCKELASDVGSGNEGGQRFHRHLGFVEVERIVNYRMAI